MDESEYCLQCGWVGTWNTEQRCKIEGVKKTCQHTAVTAGFWTDVQEIIALFVCLISVFELIASAV